VQRRTYVFSSTFRVSATGFASVAVDAFLLDRFGVVGVEDLLVAIMNISQMYSVHVNADIRKKAQLLIVMFPFFVVAWLGIAHAIPEGNVGDLVGGLILIIWCAVLEKMINVRFVLPLVRLPITWLGSGYVLVALWKLAFHKG
jgi:hypothetical protein